MKTLKRKTLSPRLHRNALRAVLAVGLCGSTALVGRIHAQQPPAQESSFNYYFPVNPSTPYVSFFAFSEPAPPSASAPPSAPRTMPTSESVNSASVSSVSSASATSAAIFSQGSSNNAGAQAESTRGSQATRSQRSNSSAEAEATRNGSPTVHGNKPGFRTSETNERVAHGATTNRAEHGPATTGPQGKETVGKESVPVEQPESSLFHFTGTAGYYSRYMFRGLDVAYRTGIDKDNESGFFGTSAAFSVGDFAFGVWYVESLKSYVPGGAGFDKSFGDPKNPLSFKSPSRQRYEEYDLFANYTLHLTKDLALTGGLNAYFFNDNRFWAKGNDHSDETWEGALSLSYTGLPYVSQSLNYYYDFDAFGGSYLEYKIATKPFTFYRHGDFSVSLVPSATVSYDFKYNGTNNGWNQFEPGFDIPITVADGVTFNFGARYSMDLGSSSKESDGKLVDRTDDRFWFSASVQYAFPNAGWHKERSYARYDGKDVIEKAVAPIEDRKWSVTVGAGIRNIESSFHVKAADAAGFANSRFGGGDLAFASPTRDANYLDGSVFSASGTQNPPAFFGLSEFSVANQSQIFDAGPGSNRQITYSSERYSGASHGFSNRDDDQPVYPFINLSREIFRRNNLSVNVGLGYEYSRSDTDSGYQLAGLAQSNQYLFTYDVDELFSSQKVLNAPFNNKNGVFSNPAGLFTVVYNSTAYAGLNNLNLSRLTDQAFPGEVLVVPDASPQLNVFRGQNALAVFSKASLHTDLHSFSIPIDVTYDIGSRIHATLSFGPTFDLFNTDLHTDTYYQLITGLPQKGNTNIDIHRSPYSSITGEAVNFSSGSPFSGIPSFGSKANFVQSTRSAVSASQAATGGKGSENGESRPLPGTTVAHTSSHNSDQQFQVGVFGKFAVDIDLDAAKRWYVQVYARYDYIPKFTVSDGTTNTSVNASSWGGGLGLGLRF